MFGLSAAGAAPVGNNPTSTVTNATNVLMRPVILLDMPSPFPGMDPYLEQRWGDFHARLVTYVADALQPGLPADLRARMEERVFVEALDAAARQVIPDVHVHETVHPGAARGGGATAVAEPDTDTDIPQPFIVRLPVEITERFIQIIDVASGNRVITILEILSPANKLPGRGREEYLRKQREAVDAGVNLVEIDLLRVGEHTTLTRPGLLPPEQLAEYHASIYRARDGGRFEYYRMPLRQRLPRLPVPLRPSDRDAVLDLQAIVNQAHERGRYDDIDYGRPVAPPLPPADSAWVEQLLQQRR